ncbi:hypothetical protein DSL72_007480 [Monilinia vaccinii-corymbosi]|uniref:Xylose isomerase-like TIM barrel domain-containing protein n=1 Tax=Monilinia vaccinii-corymbosi TaxID=61207 RepID=A0A8A3PI36_9HELO|nr:hypothetical protein DSL72_007480 [Monilinia vaccinii-corymbosi]
MDSFKPAISSMSLGRAWIHRMPSKLSAASHHNFLGLEVFYEDLEYLARSESEIESETETPSPEALLHAASTMRALCDERGITIIGLQPFAFYEGLRDRTEHAQRIAQIKLWFRLVKALGTDLIQIPASFLPRREITGDVGIVVDDLRELADLGARETPVVRFAYENLCWSTHFDTWEAGWDLVGRVDRANFGIVLDTFNIAGRVWADPSSVDGKTVDAEEALRESLERLVEKVDREKVFYIQVVDAERMREPLVRGHAFWDERQPARMSWSRNARLFAGEKGRGAYLPIEEVTRAIVEGVGYRGWVSMELFNRSMAQEGEEVPDQHARRARESWEVIQGWMKSWKLEEE